MENIDFVDFLNKHIDKISATGIRFSINSNQIDFMMVSRISNTWESFEIFTDACDMFDNMSDKVDYIKDMVDPYCPKPFFVYFKYEKINQSAISFLEILDSISSVEELKLRLAILGY